MIQALIEFPNMDNLTCGNCPCRDGGSDFCNLEYAIDGDYKCIDTIYNSRPQNCPVKYISTENMYIPFLMHKEMDIPISECQKAYDVAIEYLRSQAKTRG